jgi:hypothetical protein
VKDTINYHQNIQYPTRRRFPRSILWILVASCIFHHLKQSDGFRHSGGSRMAALMKRTGNKLRHGVAMRLVVLLALMASTATATPAPWGLGGLFGYPANNNQTSSNKNKWSSMLNVDPSKIISLMIRHGGLVIPDNIEKDLAVLAMVCRAEKVELNVLERRLLVHNFTVSMPNQEDALRIGRVYMRWDSYLRPCVEIEVDDVHILVEFFNLLLTRNNW